MPLIPQQDVLVIRGPYQQPMQPYEEAAELLKRALDNYPACRLISITAGGSMGPYSLTAAVYTI
ncbi:MAG: hypothetical protein J0H64_09405 [Actinobacteria bacterium]|nr:hypothetical protein [Actinomycetota bacterium]